MVNQRSKSGCWTCRLRRKKCPENGPPCSNCESRGVACHGYGPRPAWKDRGDKEKEEAERLQLRRCNQTRRSSSSNATDTTSGDSIYCLLPSTAFASPPPDLVSFSFSPPTVDNSSFPFPSSSPAHLDDPSFAFLPESWVPGLDSIPGLTPFGDNSSIDTLRPPRHTLQDVGLTPPASALPTGAESVLDFPANNRLPPSEEREIELTMQYLERDFPRQHPSYGAPTVGVRAWLMCSFKRSSSFRYASLCISAYFDFLKAPSHDGPRRTELFREYDRFKQLAAKAHALLLEASVDGSRGDQSLAQRDFMLGEKIVSSVQLAALESLEENHDSALSYLDSASLDLIQYHDHGSFIDSDHTILPGASPMERKAVEFFTCVLIWIHVLHCSTRQTIPRGATLYRQLLASDSPFAKSFVDIVGLEGWVLDALMDTIEVSLWKREQEAKNRLSMRELIGKTDSILATLNQQLQNRHDGPIQTHIFAHAIAIHAHALTSGYQPAVPEIKETLEKAVPLWLKLDPNSHSIKRLSWAFCVSASLASEAQRSVFEGVLSAVASADALSAAVPLLKSTVEECWKLLDAGSPSCNWQDVMQRMGCNIHSVLFT
ncbi:putative C6 transcription factor [Chaetomium tenue]|uniref:C6 transcription factor n=1 Tax=Chaetomium tenue TaxID=1854479 RepID=A0ACB7P275_9PEZI|nr:putative C6 transcription factor [Chaetomium globosum]